ncbi:MAG: SIS domain-containing protein [Deltaproteobacteria bacterium]|nr:MAG: SIS domain-containing protein [Deltaproteobacteria bacterium]
MAGVPVGSLVFFPLQSNFFCCGLAGIVAFKKKGKTSDAIDTAALDAMAEKIYAHRFQNCIENDYGLESHYLGGSDAIEALHKSVHTLKGKEPFYTLFSREDIQQKLNKLAARLDNIIASEAQLLAEKMGLLASEEVDVLSKRIEDLRDINWCLSSEIADNIENLKNLIHTDGEPPGVDALNIYKNINAVLNSIDRLEVRGRDSAGISLLFILDKAAYEKFTATLDNLKLLDRFKERSDEKVLINNSISIHETTDTDDQALVTVSFTYKIAAEIGRLGDNIRFLRKQIRHDPIFKAIVAVPHRYHTVSSHTRWASVGAITEPNCHPVDNQMLPECPEKSGIIHVCLNGDIDNYLELKAAHEKNSYLFYKEITTDTKIIPIQIEKYLNLGFNVVEAFRLAVNDFEGSHAISMHTDLMPGRIFLAQKGSGQSIFVGLADDHYMPTSEVYGFVEETPFYLKLDGETVIEGKNGPTQGQIFILSQESAGGLDGITAMYYDGTPMDLQEKDIKHTAITPRDIDRQDFPHYFLKEISESPASVEKTLQNRWKIRSGDQQYIVTLDETIVPAYLTKALTGNRWSKRQIRRICFVGQGTAGVAALACANILDYYLGDPGLHISALKASELSGFNLGEDDDRRSLTDTLVIAISQSGTTTDTNRTVDMVRERGAYTLAIVNRRDSDITFKVDGVMYTSSGRDIEMSVASTKAFYSQIIAGAILGLYIAGLRKRRNQSFISNEIKQLLEIPSHMRKILSMRESIEKSATRLAPTRTYWAAVGSGPNKASADEIRIKLSELCYKTISSDFVEDKKHIDLSSEPLIIVCAAGTRETVIGDIIKDTAIFKAHKATPVVIANEGDGRFDPYAEDVFYVPVVQEHLAPILNTLVGHIWGYYAALAINQGSQFLYGFQEDIQKTVDRHIGKDLDVYEVVLEKSFREKIARFYNEFRAKKAQNRFPAIMGLEAASDLTLLLKYLSGKLPVSDFELDFGLRGTPLNMLNRLFKCLAESINSMARPVDAIKHQAKTVTVGTSRISEKVEGILFEALAAHAFNASQLTTSNIIVLKNLQGIISKINGTICYKIENLNLLGEPTDETTIRVEKKDGILASIPSRVETDTTLKGTKKIIVIQGNVYIGKGRKDDRSICVIPVISSSPDAPNIIRYLLLLNISFQESVPLATKIKALGGKYEHIKNIVQENSVAWKDELLELVAIEELFGKSAEKIGEFIVSARSKENFKAVS